MTDNTDTESQRNLIVSEFLTLDGVMEAPEQWSFQFFSEEQQAYKHDELFASGALLLGRTTYETFAAAWPDQEDETGFADRMNSLPKYIVSTSLEEATWNNSTIIDGDVTEEVAALKQEDGKDILVNGSGELVDTLVEHDLVDEYRLMVHPVVQGSGKRLFGGATAPTTMRLVDTEAFDSGVVVLTYGPSEEDHLGEEA
ncbi:dihydrofolate reductase family protein [Natrinema gelatinilyticum]|uniref:dihydrofolate reductase family protein n=1 Tax=Natrinema gelatinilyticum TaxID=2961571 RepID=UPI0020C3CBE2|nr:dihydrofolate reductase family protein [Natrinema gelatinilyticum]